VRRGRLIPASTPAPPSRSDWLGAELVRRGRLIPASDPTPLALPTGPTDVTIDSTDVVSDLREERL